MSLPEDDLGPVRAGRARKGVVYHRLARPQRRHEATLVRMPRRHKLLCFLWTVMTGHRQHD